MTDNKLAEPVSNSDRLTDSEIVKALDICSKSTNGCSHSKYTCEDCYLNGQPMCSAVLLQDTIDYFNRLQAENERLSKENIALNRRAIPSSGCILKVGNALLFAEKQEDYNTTINHIKAEAYKECIEKVSNIITEIYNKHIFGDNDLEAEEKDAIINFSDDVTYAIDNLLKERLGENNA